MPSDEEIDGFWENHPVGGRFHEDSELNEEFFHAFDRRRYSAQDHIQSFLDEFEFEGKNVLEIGTGHGADAEQIIERGANYTGVDLTQESITRTAKRFELFQLPNIGLANANAKHLPFASSSFDIVYSFGVLHHIPNVEAVVDEIDRVLKPRGEIGVMLYHKHSLNYHISISIIRRLGIFLLLIPGFSSLISSFMEDPPETFQIHRSRLKEQGLNYLKMKNFIHANTDGPLNPYSRVYDQQSAENLFSQFNCTYKNAAFINDRQFLYATKILPGGIRDWLASNFGWHLLLRFQREQ